LGSVVKSSVLAKTLSSPILRAWFNAILILIKASARVPIAGIKMKCGNFSGAIARSESKVALKKTEIVIKIGFTPFLAELSVPECQTLSEITMNPSNHP
jgi:hypothetical protein